MNSSQILAWLSAHWTAAWPVVSAALVLLLRSRTPEQWVALGETSPRLQGLVRLLRAVGLDPAKAVSALVQIVSGRAPSRASLPPAPPSRTGQSGRATVGAIALLLAVGLCLVGLGAMLSGCPAPRLPVVEGCTVGASRCRADHPQVCSSTGRWHDVGDLTCARSGGVCTEGVDGGVAHCALALPSNPYATDGGSDVR